MRNCENCKRHTDNGCTSWECEFEPTTKNCESCRYYGLHHEVCNYCYKCSLWTEQEPTKNDLGVDCISRQWLLDIAHDIPWDTEKDLNRFVHHVRELAPSVEPHESEVLDELRAEVTTLQNRCYALTKGTMCMFCKYECEYKSDRSV